MVTYVRYLIQQNVNIWLATSQLFTSLTEGKISPHSHDLILVVKEFQTPQESNKSIEEKNTYLCYTPLPKLLITDPMQSTELFLVNKMCWATTVFGIFWNHNQ